MHFLADAIRNTDYYKVTGVLLLLVQLAGLFLVALTWTVRERTAVAASVLDFIAGLFLVCLLRLEHVRSIRPSFLISAFLLISILLDVSRVRTEWLRGAGLTFAAILTSTLSVKIIILSLETVEKRRLLPLRNKRMSTESTSGPFNRGFFVWLNALLQAGFSSLLSLESLPSIYEKLAADKTHEKIDSEWTRCKSCQSYHRALVRLTLPLSRQSATEILLTEVHPKMLQMGDHDHCPSSAVSRSS